MKRDIFLSLLSSLFLILSFPNYNLWFLAWFGFVPLFLAIQGKSKAKAFLLSYITGAIFWFGVVYWLIHVTLPGLIILVLYLALYFGIFGLIISACPLSLVPCHPFLISSLWVLLEYIRSHLFTGFPWALLGYSQYLNLPVIQIADVAGVWGVSWLVMLVNVTIYSAVSHKPQSASAKKRYLVPVLCIIITLGYGYYKLHKSWLLAPSSRLKISVIQGNIPQQLKWAPEARKFIMGKYLNLTRQALKDNPDLIIWPEAALPVVIEEEPDYYEKVRGFVKEIRVPVLVGAVRKENEFYYNSAILLSGEGGLLNTYDKLHLVPFGEYIPLRKILPFLETVVPIGDFAAGKEYVLFNLSAIRYPLSAKFGVLICFEDLFPELSRNFVKKGAQFLVNITNDAWFGKTSSPYQHLQASVFRAVENRVPVVRSANTGISGFIVPSGEIISLVRDKTGREIFLDGFLTQEIKIGKHQLSFYTRFGGVFIFICVLLILYVIIALPKRMR